MAQRNIARYLKHGTLRPEAQRPSPQGEGRTEKLAFARGQRSRSHRAWRCRRDRGVGPY
jgi:hypothetical protein